MIFLRDIVPDVFSVGLIGTACFADIEAGILVLVALITLVIQSIRLAEIVQKKKEKKRLKKLNNKKQ